MNNTLSNEQKVAKQELCDTSKDQRRHFRRHLYGVRDALNDRDMPREEYKCTVLCTTTY